VVHLQIYHSWETCVERFAMFPVVTWSITKDAYHLANPFTGYASIAISIGRKMGCVIAHRGRCLISMIALFHLWINRMELRVTGKTVISLTHAIHKCLRERTIFKARYRPTGLIFLNYYCNHCALVFSVPYACICIWWVIFMTWRL